MQDKEFDVEVEAKRISDNLVDIMVQYRKQMNLTQQNIADATGIKRANVARIEAKKYLVSLESLLRYAECLNLDVSIELKERQGEKQMKLTILVDNNTFIDQYYHGEPAASFFIETEDKKVLFDTGYSEILISNAKKMGID